MKLFSTLLCHKTQGYFFFVKKRGGVEKNNVKSKGRGILIIVFEKFYGFFQICKMGGITWVQCCAKATILEKFEVLEYFY